MLDINMLENDRMNPLSLTKHFKNFLQNKCRRIIKEIQIAINHDAQVIHIRNLKKQFMTL